MKRIGLSLVAFIFILTLVPGGGPAMAADSEEDREGATLEYTVTIRQGVDTAHVALKISDVNKSYIDIGYGANAEGVPGLPEAREDSILNLSAESGDRALTVRDTGERTWRILSPGNSVAIQYDIPKIVPWPLHGVYGPDPLCPYENATGVYIDDDYTVIIVQFLLIYPLNLAVGHIQLGFDVPDEWKVLAPYEEIDRNAFVADKSGASLLGSFLNKLLYMGEMEIYAEEYVNGCRLQMGIPKGDDNKQNLTTQDVENYLHSCALVLTKFSEIYGENPYKVYNFYPSFQKTVGDKVIEPRVLTNFNGFQYDDRMDHLAGHLSLGLIENGYHSPLRAQLEIVKGVGEMYTGHKLGWELTGNEVFLGNMYYFYLVYDRMHGTRLASHEEYSSYIKGEWVALLLDKKIQEVTNGSKDLYSVVQNLYSKYKQSWHEVTYKDIEKESEAITGHDFSDMFRKYVYGDKKIPAYQYLEPYKKYFLLVPLRYLDQLNHGKTYGHVFPPFISIEMALQRKAHIMAGIMGPWYMETFADYMLEHYEIDEITEEDVEDALSELTGQDCSGFFHHWEDSFGVLHLEDLKRWLRDYERPVKFTLSNLSIEPKEVTPGQPVTITVSLTHKLPTWQDHTIALAIDDIEEARRTVKVGPDGTTVIFTVIKDEVGEHSAEVRSYNAVRGSFSVVEAAPQTELPSETESPMPELPTSGVNWPKVVGITVAVALVAVGALRLRKKRAN